MRKTELTMDKMTITEDKEERLSTAMNRLLEESNKKPKMSIKLRQYFKSSCMNKSTNTSGQKPTVDAVFDSLIQVYITHMNHAKMDMAVDTFFMRIIFPTVVLNPFLLSSCSLMPGWWGKTTHPREGGIWASLCLISITEK